MSNNLLQNTTENTQEIIQKPSVKTIKLLLANYRVEL